MSKAVDLAKKLKALADKGVGGEKQNAEQMLEKLLQKHNLTIHDIEGEKINKHYFNIKEDKRGLLLQVVKTTNKNIKMYGEFKKNQIKQYSLGGNYMIECTISEFIEIKARFDFYSILYDEEKDIFYTAFLHANDLLVENTTDEQVTQISSEEKQRQERALLMSGRIKKGQYLKRLEKQNNWT